MITRIFLGVFSFSSMMSAICFYSAGHFSMALGDIAVSVGAAILAVKPELLE